ncbi:threonine/serine exporter family protein [Vagococcus intermedius]|uniref:Threonine/serine exporter family protein n=1 Tax=Vagococcus intermedius TaxID=2991418 RepID=A0AAF0CTS8_9ENTE|nr:threonine/serine exporter family protein [Vagococcus intermedius]WEG72830.1 threonine/serine exporter family protein [Vagococcus intermedius]WEG74916.1 threonine/serine exporter family protein [Vagococcus intermedius]
MSLEEKNFLLETCVLAGKVMLENGAEMYRVEDTMNRIAASQEEEGISFVTQTVVLMSLESTKNIQMKRVSERTTNLGKVSWVNDLSWGLSTNRITIKELNKQLREVERYKAPTQVWLKILSSALISGCLMILLGGTWPDFFATCLVGAGGYGAYYISATYLRLKYIDEFISAFIMGSLAFIMIKIGWGFSLDDMIIGSIMPLVPGVALTNTIRDLQEGHMLSGVLRGVEALIIAMMIGAGIAASFGVMG